MKTWKVEAAIIAVGMVLLGVIIKWGINDFIDKERIVSVKGLAEMEVPADKAGVVTEVLVKVGSKVNEGDVIVKVQSDASSAKAPASGNVDDIEVLKYKISLLSGVYMEYDTKLKQYNWS